MVCLDRLRDVSGLGNPSSVENAADPAAGNIIQSSVAHYCGVPSLGNGQVGGFTGGRHHLGVLVGDPTDHRRTVGLCVCELPVQASEAEQAADDLRLGASYVEPAALFPCPTVIRSFHLRMSTPLISSHKQNDDSPINGGRRIAGIIRSANVGAKSAAKQAIR